MLDKFFRHTLAAKGFGHIEKINWSLNNCQGDGCNFSCIISQTEAIHHLRKSIVSIVDSNTRRRIKEKMNVAKLAGRLNYFITRYTNDFTFVVDIRGHASHEMAMYVDFNGEPNFLTETDEDEFPVTMGVISGVLQDYVRSTAKCLERSGYELLDAINAEDKLIRSYRTKNFRVDLRESDAQQESAHIFDYCGDETVISLCSEMQTGKDRITSLTAQVYLRSHDDDADMLLAEHGLNNISIATSDNGYSGYKKEVLTIVLMEARSKLEMMQGGSRKVA